MGSRRRTVAGPGLSQVILSQVILSQVAGCASGATGEVVAVVDAGRDAPRATGAGTEAGVDAGNAADATIAREGGLDRGSDAAAPPLDGRSSSDAPPDCPAGIEALRAAAGPIDLTVCGVVTYVYEAGFFLQAAAGPEGPAIQVYEGASFSPDGIEEGDEIRMRVTEVGDFFGTVQVWDHDPVEVRRGGGDVEEWVQDLSGGTLPAEALEAEIVRVRDAAVTAVDGRHVTLSYGTATGVELRVSDPASLCVGATLDVVAVVTEYDGIYRIETFRSGDLEALDVDGCPGGTGRVPVPGDLLLNEFLADPPAGAAGDANCDGTRDAMADEFVEIVNVSGDVVALDGVAVSDDVEVRHVFAVRTDLRAGKAVVVFGGGSPSCGWGGDVLVVSATSGRLSLNNEGDTIAMADSDGTVLQTLSYGAEAGHDESRTLEPDLDDEDGAASAVTGFVGHAAADADDMSPSSPGTRIDDTVF